MQFATAAEVWICMRNPRLDPRLEVLQASLSWKSNQKFQSDSIFILYTHQASQEMANLTPDLHTLC